MFHRPFGTLRHIAVKAFDILAVFALGRKFPQRVSTDNAADFRQILTGGFQRSGKERQHRQRRFSGIEINGIFIELQATQQGVHIVQSRHRHALIPGGCSLAHILGL